MSKKLKIIFKEIQNIGQLKNAAALISKHSWGSDYPIQPINELKKADYKIWGFVGNNLIGFAAVSRFGSPDDKDTDALWFGYLVVTPEFRRRGIAEDLYDYCLKYCRRQTGRILACTDNPIMERFLLKRGWDKLRVANDEASGACVVFEYCRSKN